MASLIGARPVPGDAIADFGELQFSVKRKTRSISIPRSPIRRPDAVRDGAPRATGRVPRPTAPPTCPR